MLAIGCLLFFINKERKKIIIIRACAQVDTEKLKIEKKKKTDTEGEDVNRENSKNLHHNRGQK